MTKNELIKLVDEAKEGLFEHMKWIGSEEKLIKGLIAAWILNQSHSSYEDPQLNKDINELIRDSKHKYLYK